MTSDLTHGFEFGAFIAEPLKGCVVGDDGQPRHLPPKEMAVLTSLAEVAPQPLTREDLIDKVWGDRCVSDEVLTHAITVLRHALDDCSTNPKYIQTIPKRGYRLLTRARPVNKAEQPAVTAVSGPAAQRRTSSGWDIVRRNPLLSAMSIGSFAAALVALYYLHDDSFVPKPAQLTSETAGTLEHSSASELLLQAESLDKRITPENARKAELLLERAVSLDPDNAPAWALLGRIYFRQTGLFRARPLQEGMELARQAVQRALVVNPHYGPAHADLALIQLSFDFDFDGAFTHLRQAQDLSPADPYVLRVAAKMEMTHAHVEHAIEFLERSIRIDPYSCMSHAELGQAYYFAGRLDDAERALQNSLALNADVVRTRYLLGLVRLADNAVERALTVLEEEPDEGFRMAGIAIVQHALDERDLSDEALASTERSPLGPRPYPVAIAYASRGQHDAALDWLELAYNQRDGETIFLLVDPLLFSLRTRPRWERLVEKLGLSHKP